MAHTTACTTVQAVIRGTTNDGERATERSQWRQFSLTSFVLKPFVAARTCL